VAKIKRSLLGVALGHKIPAHHVSHPGGDVVRAFVLVLEVVGVFPDINAEQRRTNPRSRVCPDLAVGSIFNRLPSRTSQAQPLARTVRARPLVKEPLNSPKTAEAGINRLGPSSPLGTPPPSFFIICQKQRMVVMAATIVTDSGADAFRERHSKSFIRSSDRAFCQVQDNWRLPCSDSRQ